MSKYGCVLNLELRKKLRALEDEKKNSFRKRLYYRFFKRFADISCSIVCLLVLIITFPFISIAILLDSPGPVIFSQIRVGQRGHLFKIYKFRTMRKDAEELIDDAVFHNKDNPFVQHKNDPRVTRVGHFLRKYSIDELPQLFCVLAGTMSFIGPRPFIPKEIEALDEKYMLRLMVKPGLTGLAQISGRGDLPLEQRMEKDLEYIDHMSARLDIKILWTTLVKIIKHEGAQ